MTIQPNWNQGFSLALVSVLLMAASGAAIAQHAGAHAGGAAAGGAHQHFDGRFSHNQYYYDRGYTIAKTRRWAGSENFAARTVGGIGVNGGNWYRWRGGAWVVSAAPVGLFYVPWLPPYFTTVWWNGIPYYYANDTYYIWDDAQHAYKVVDAARWNRHHGDDPGTCEQSDFRLPQQWAVLRAAGQGSLRVSPLGG